MSSAETVPVHPAASILMMRDGSEGTEFLYLRRNPRLAFHGGAWVFPGGRIDEEDQAADGAEAAARRAAVREALEEAGLEVHPDDLTPICHWTTPSPSPRRFATWFFLATAGDEAVQVDGGEIHEHRWMAPDDALRAQSAGEMELPVPTYVLSLRLRHLRTTREVHRTVRGWEPEVLLPRIHQLPQGRVALYQQDAGYESGDLDAPPPRHRVWMLESGWRYEREI
jgi:8-oxo-dGTP pyrophosphatase MutT (NUDIX family)